MDLLLFFSVGSDRMCAIPLRAGAGILDPVSESESQMDLSGFFAFGAGGFLGLGAASEGFLAATYQRKHDHYMLLYMVRVQHNQSRFMTYQWHFTTLNSAKYIKLC